MAKRKTRLLVPEQSARFIEAAKKSRSGWRPEEFDKVLKRIAPDKTRSKRPK
jgi:hypothetical protein